MRHSNLMVSLALAAGGVICAPANAQSAWITPVADAEAQILDAGAKLSDGSYLSVGLSTAISRSGRLLAARLASDGTLIWQREYALSEIGQRGTDVLPLDDGGAILVGSARLPGGDGDNRPWLLRVDAGGEIVWNSVDGLTQEIAVDSAIVSAATLGNGDLVIAGGTNTVTDVQDPWLARIDAHGALLQFVSYPPAGGPGFGVATYVDDLQATPDGGLVLSGSATSSPGSALLWKFDQHLQPQWHRIYAGADLYRGSSVVADESGYWIAGAGFSQTSASLVRTDLSGAVVQTFQYPSPLGYGDGPAIAVDGAERLWLLRTEFSAFGASAAATELLQLDQSGSVIASHPLIAGEVATVLVDLVIGNDQSPVAIGYRRQNNNRGESDGAVVAADVVDPMIFASTFDG